jgi:hypothetical protein
LVTVGEFSGEELDAAVKRLEREREESRVRVNRLIAARDPNRPERYAQKKNKLLLDLTNTGFYIKRLKAELQEQYEKYESISAAVKKLESDYVNGEPTI